MCVAPAGGDVPDADEDRGAAVAQRVEDGARGGRGQHVAGQVDGAEDGVHRSQAASAGEDFYCCRSGASARFRFDLVGLGLGVEPNSL